MFTESTLLEIIGELKLKELKEVVLAEQGSLIINGLKFKTNKVSFIIPDEKDFYKLTSHEYASPVRNFQEDNQNFTIRTKYGLVHFYNRYFDTDNYCNWDTQIKIYYMHENYLKRLGNGNVNNIREEE